MQTRTLHRVDEHHNPEVNTPHHSFSGDWLDGDDSSLIFSKRRLSEQILARKCARGSRFESNRLSRTSS
jgi:hypothetical protein